MDFITIIIDSIGTIIDFFKTIFDIIVVILCFLPEPFFQITMGFSSILLIIFAYRFYKG